LPLPVTCGGAASGGQIFFKSSSVIAFLVV
jgi:hypothetical protein